jgi:DUF3102 family protein
MTKRTALDNPILAEHAAAIRRLGKRAIEDVIEIGRHLVEARAEVKKLGGSFTDWLKAEFDWEQAQAYNFIHVYERQSELTKFVNSDLPISALYLLAAPSTPEEARTEIITRAEAGETVPVAEVKRTIERTKGRKQRARKPPQRKSSRPGSRDMAKPPARDDEIERKLARLEELEHKTRTQEITIEGLRGEIEELRGKLAATGTGGGDPMSYSEFLTAIKKWEDLHATDRTENANLRSENVNLRSEVEELRAKLDERERAR